MSGDPGVVMKILRNNELREQSLLDPVGKFRVCEPQTLIDTDFEYGLQTTKWETIELVNNIPTFYSRDNDESLSLSNVTTVADSFNVYVHTSSNHGLIVGSPVIVQGVNSFSAEGSYVVNAVVNNTQFAYKAKALQTVTGSIYDNISTQVYIGKLYQGTQYNLDALGYIRTDGTNQILVDTLYPHGFTKDTSFILSKSVGQKQLIVSNCNVDVVDSFSLSNTVFSTSNSGLTNPNPYYNDNVIIHKWTGKLSAFVDNADVNASTNTITCSNHGFLQDDFAMYVPPPLTLSNLDAAYLEEDAARTPDISTFNVTNAYTYTYDGTTNTISTGGSSMFAGGNNNAHFFGTSSSPSFQINYNTTNWTNYDSSADYRTFGQTQPFCTVIRHINSTAYYYRIDNPVIGAQNSTIHERNGSTNSVNNMYCRWNYFGLYNNGTRPSFYYLVASVQSYGSFNYPTNQWWTGSSTGTGGWTSITNTYQINNVTTGAPCWTIVMMLSRQNGQQITLSDMSNVVTRICNFFQTFTGVMGEYRLLNMHLYNYNNAGDTFINDGGNMFDNNRLGNIYSIDNQILSYRDRLFTTLPNTPNVEYKFISGCNPQIMFSRVLEQRTVNYTVSDTFTAATGSIEWNWWWNENYGEWLCRWGYYGIYNRGRPSMYRIFMQFSSNSGGYPSMSPSMQSSSLTNPIFNLNMTPWSSSNFPTYVAFILLSQPNGGQISQGVLRNVVLQVLGNCQYMTTPSWPLSLVKYSQQVEYNEYNTIGGLRPMECYQVNVVNAHQFQLMNIPRWDSNAYLNVGEHGITANSAYWTDRYDYGIDITTNFFNFRALFDNRSYVRYANPYQGYQPYGISGYRVELLDDQGISRYSYQGYVGGYNSGYSEYFYFQNMGTLGSLTDPVRRFGTFRILAWYRNYGYDSMYFRWNDVIPAFRYAPLTRPVLALTQGSAREYVGKHAFKKAYRIHYFAQVGDPNTTNYYFNFVRKGNDPLSIESSDSMCMFHHPELMSMEAFPYSRNNTISRVIMPDWNGVCGPGIPRTNTSTTQSIPSYDNLKNGNSTRYWMRPGEFNVYNNYSAIRIQNTNNNNGTSYGTLYSNNNLRWWPGTSWFVFVRDIPERNSIVIPNHNIPNNTPIQVDNVTGLGIREIPTGTYFVNVLNSGMIRLKTSSGTTTTLDMSAFDASTMRFFYTLANANRDSFFVQDHGLIQGTPLVYTSSVPIHPLVDTQTYYATNITRDRFSLSATRNGARLNLGGTQLFEDVSTTTNIGTGNIVATLNNVTLNTAGVGSGSSGGFLPPNGQSYLLFNGPGTREIITKALNVSDSSVLTILVIRGTNTNGGDVPESGEELWAAYSLNGGASWTDIAIIANTSIASSWSPLTVTIPVVARTGSTTFKLYQKLNSGINNDNYGIQYIKIDNNQVLDLTDTHSFAIGGIGAVDGTYVTSAVTQNSSTLALIAPFNLPAKTIYINPANVVNFKDNTLYLPNHNMRSGALLKYQINGNTAMVPLMDNTDYYATRIDENNIRLATTYTNSVNNTNITIASLGTGTSHILQDYSVGGEILSTSTVSGTAGQTLVTGEIDGALRPLTQFTSELRVGNFMNIIIASSAYDDYVVTSIDSNTFTISLRRIVDNGGIAFVTGDAVMFAPPFPRRDSTVQSYGTSNGSISGLTSGRIYYASVTGNTMRLFNTMNDAMISANVIQVTSGSGIFTSLRPSTILNSKIVDIKNNRFLVVDNPHSVTFAQARYLLSTNLFVKADGFALHRAYDGGVELIPPQNSDSQMIRQTRKYFRYQSGKGIQISLAVNFSAPVDVDRLTRNGSLAFLSTKRPHRLSPGVDITVEGSTDNDWNGTYNIVSVVDSTTLLLFLSVIPQTVVAPGNMCFYVNSWNNSFLRCGLFDDQNGMFYEYDGNVLYAVRRSSTLQLSGTSSLTFNSPVVTGTLTTFSSQLSVGNMIVIKGMSYKVVSIESDTRLFIQPVYRGISKDGVIITKTVDVRVPSSQWNIDRCDGTGPTGFNLNIHRIQMSYMDYSWYGAGKIRFGFKDTNGEVRYMHEFIHNNILNEAYLRSGNLPCRYEVMNRGYPTYTPALMHWGTSVIMDGKFDDDKAYLFTAAGQVLSFSGNDGITVNSVSSIEFLFGGSFGGGWWIYDSSLGRSVFAYAICAPTSEYSKVANVRSGSPISGGFLQANTTTVSQPQRYSNATYGTVIWINRPPTSSSNQGQSVVVGNTTVTVERTIPSIIPLISIRLAPSVDNSRPGVLGSREVITRMQLILKNVGILTTHDCEIRLLLNGSIDNKTWQRVTPPSLSQLVYHARNDNVDNGTQIFNFRIPGGSPDGTGKRTAISSTYDISELVTLGNSVLGGDGIFPDGPDLLTICASVLDTSGITSQNPFTITGRVTWTESQA